MLQASANRKVRLVPKRSPAQPLTGMNICRGWRAEFPGKCGQSDVDVRHAQQVMNSPMTNTTATIHLYSRSFAASTFLYGVLWQPVTYRADLSPKLVRG